MHFGFSWPSGKYCIYKRGHVCPKGLREGFVVWDDENTDNQNDKAGALPEGHYGEDTKIYFCCSVHGSVEKAIMLPTERPFFLFAYGSINCQKVSLGVFAWSARFELRSGPVYFATRWK